MQHPSLYGYFFEDLSVGMQATVSRTITKLARDKVIAIIPDGVRVLDSDRLKAAAVI